MNEKNFNSISQFEVPKSWIDNALSVPATHKKKPFPLIKLTRTLAAVACLVLVCGISVALYFMINDSSIPPVKDPFVTENKIIDGSSDTVQTDNINKENEDSSENNSINKAENEATSGSDITNVEDNTQNGTGSHPEPNEEPQKPTTNVPDKPQNPETTVPSEDDTNGSEPVAPTQEESSDSTTPDDPIQAPTEGPLPSEPTEKPKPPWVAPTENPTIGPVIDPTVTPTIIQNPNYNKMILVLIGEKRVAAAKSIYCALYDENNRMIGDSNMYSSSHIAYKGSTKGGRTEVYYYPYHNTNILEGGTYTYVFYNENGEEMYRGTCNLQAYV